MSKERGDALEREVAKLRLEVGQELERTEQAHRRLREIMEKATALFTRNSADATVQVEQLQVELAKLRGTVDELTRQKSDIEQQLQNFKKQLDEQQANASQKQPALSENKDDLYRQASALIANGNHEQGRRLLRHFLARFPGDQRAGSVQLSIGDSYYAQQKFAPAIQEYRKVVESYRNSALVPDALYKIGMSFYQLKYCSDAASFFNELLKKHPSHQSATKARKVLKLIRRFRRNRRICTS